MTHFFLSTHAENRRSESGWDTSTQIDEVTKFVSIAKLIEQEIEMWKVLCDCEWCWYRIDVHGVGSQSLWPRFSLNVEWNSNQITDFQRIVSPCGESETYPSIEFEHVFSFSEDVNCIYSIEINCCFSTFELHMSPTIHVDEWRRFQEWWCLGTNSSLSLWCLQWEKTSQQNRCCLCNGGLDSGRCHNKQTK